MNPGHPTLTACRPARPFTRLALVASLALLSTARASDRFFVPVTPPSSGGGGANPGPSGGGSSGGGTSSPGGSGSHDGGSSPGGSGDAGGGNSGGGGGRFFVPMPGRGSGGGGGGGGSGGGVFWPDPYWGGCYYWDGRYHYWPGYYGDWYSDYGYSRPVYRAAPAGRTDPLAMTGPMVFFPPEPPPLGTPLPGNPPRRDGVVPAPAGLNTFPTALFYPQLSVRLHRGNLDARQLDAIAGYRAERLSLLTELRARIQDTRTLSRVERLRALDALARAQDERLRTLEASAEALRTGLLRGGLLGALGDSGDWNANRKWRLGGRGWAGREQTLGLEFRVMRAAAFYQDGLSLEQRRFVREIAMELQAKAYQPAASTGSDGDSRLIFFSPAPARVRFADDLPASINARLDAFTTLREHLKAELRDVLYTRDMERSRARANALRRLAAHQAPRLDELESLAEAIRTDLDLLGRPLRQPPPPSPPADLAARITALRAERAEVQLNFDRRLDAIRSALLSSDVETRSRMNLDFAAWRTERDTRMAAIDETRARLRQDLARHYATGVRPVSDAAIDALLDARDETDTPEALWARYSDYADAVLLTGLSPAQRRLLFDGALEALDLPLPAGERMP